MTERSTGIRPEVLLQACDRIWNISSRIYVATYPCGPRPADPPTPTTCLVSSKPNDGLWSQLEDVFVREQNDGLPGTDEFGNAVLK